MSTLWEPSWETCHMNEWNMGLGRRLRQNIGDLLSYISAITLNPSILIHQVSHFKFGISSQQQIFKNISNTHKSIKEMVKPCSYICFALAHVWLQKCNYLMTRYDIVYNNIHHTIQSKYQTQRSQDLWQTPFSVRIYHYTLQAAWCFLKNRVRVAAFIIYENTSISDNTTDCSVAYLMQCPATTNTIYLFNWWAMKLTLKQSTLFILL